jgi:hypothetical protein
MTKRAWKQYTAEFKATAVARQDPGNALWQRDLVVSQGTLGLLALARGDAARAVTWLEQAQAIAAHLAQLNPTNPQATADLAWVREQLDAARAAQTAR